MVPSIVTVTSFSVLLVTTLSAGQGPLGQITCQCSCPTGWFGFNDRCFLYVSAKKTWVDSEIHCVNLKANLASVHIETEFQLLKELIKLHNPAEEPAWIGLSDNNKEGTWMWSDGSKFDFSKWNNGEPNGLRNENCVHTNWGSQKGWNDKNCDDTFAFICSLRSH